eukprot:11447840-Prorocentrum_lima.AAC.1
MKASTKRNFKTEMDSWPEQVAEEVQVAHPDAQMVQFSGALRGMSPRRRRSFRPSNPLGC